mmetsp:Transcript_7844/g.15028  ORF Transcript_7844/g.15028 Transcript_7844/m.15028 type:complete len:225 (+) Transcript_7844:9772-10446(+)
MSTVKTLLGLQRSTEVARSQAPPSEKYSSLFELIIAKFSPEKTSEIMRKSASLFASNPTKMGEWISFMQSSFANFVFHGAEVMTELSEYEKLKEFLVKKNETMRDHLTTLSRDDEILKQRAEADRQVKNHLIRRLHELEFGNIEQLSVISRLSQERAEFEVDKLALEKSLAIKEDTFQREKHLLASEVRRLKQLEEHAELQKDELLDAFKDFQRMFESFELEFS